MIVSISNWKDLIRRDFPKDVPITEQTIETTKKYASRFRGSVRMAKGRMWISSEFEKRRKRILQTPLP